MPGVLFIIIVPCTDYEKELRKWERYPKEIIGGDRNPSRIIEELKINKKFGSQRSSIESYAQDDNNVVLSKCKSSDCLHSDKEKVLEKSYSELNLGEEEKSSLGYKNYVKSSWEEIKQTIKPRKQKLKITSRRKDDDNLHCETSLEAVSFFLFYILSRLKAVRFANSETKYYHDDIIMNCSHSIINNKMS